MSNELKNAYGENVSWFCYEGSLALHDNYDEDNAGYVVSDFDIECDNGCVNIDTIALLESAHVVIDEKSDQITQLEKDKAELVEALQNYVDAIGNDRGLAAIGKCFRPAKELLERMK
jgi:hypothetical protein